MVEHYTDQTDYLGPVSTLPGARFPTRPGIKCEDCNTPAMVRVQGETDSFGAEYHDLCATCATRLREYMNSLEARTGRCDWCKNQVTTLRPHRDFEEGFAGRVYQVCDDCRRQETEYWLKQEEEYDDNLYYEDYEELEDDFYDEDYEEPEEDDYYDPEKDYYLSLVGYNLLVESICEQRDGWEAQVVIQAARMADPHRQMNAEQRLYAISFGGTSNPMVWC